MNYSRNSHKEANTIPKESVIGRAFVTSTFDVTENQGPRIRIHPVGQSSPITADLLHANSRERGVPEEGSLVYYTMRRGDRAVVLGVIGDEHDGYEVDERVIHHPTLNSSIRLNGDGTVEIVNDDGTTVKVSDDGIQINDGNSPVITDIETSTSDGYVTDVEAIVNESILV